MELSGELLVRAGHVVQPEAVGGIRVGGRRADITVVPGVAGRKAALPDVAPVLPVGHNLGPPCEASLVQLAGCGVLPLHLGRQATAGPGCEGRGVVPRDVDDGMVAAVGHVGPGTLWLAPVLLAALFDRALASDSGGDQELAGVLRLWLWKGLQRENERKGRAGAGTAADFHTTMMALGDGGHDGQSQP